MERVITEELIKFIEAKKKPSTISSFATGYNYACDEIIEVIKLSIALTQPNTKNTDNVNK